MELKTLVAESEVKNLFFEMARDLFGADLMESEHALEGCRDKKTRKNLFKNIYNDMDELQDALRKITRGDDDFQVDNRGDCIDALKDRIKHMARYGVKKNTAQEHNSVDGKDGPDGEAISILYNAFIGLKQKIERGYKRFNSKVIKDAINYLEDEIRHIAKHYPEFIVKRA